MRLYNTYYLCKNCEKAFDNLEFSVIKTNQDYEIKNWIDFKEALFALRQVAALKESIDAFYEVIPIFVREKMNPLVDRDTKIKMSTKKSIINHKLKAIIALYESLNLSANNNGIDVKIPECDSLDRYMYYLKEIDFIFNHCPYLQHNDGQIVFKTVDVGSQWITFLISMTAGTVAATYILKNLAMLVDKAVQVNSHLLNVRQQEEIVRTQNLANNNLESTLEVFEKLKKHYFTNAIKEIGQENETSFLEYGEEYSKVEISFEKLCNLMEKGVEIYASIDTQKDIQILFPALEDKIELPDNIIKLLEDKA